VGRLSTFLRSRLFQPKLVHFIAYLSPPPAEEASNLFDGLAVLDGPFEIGDRALGPRRAGVQVRRVVI
jgi:hypothetical protein